jgi:hypothetical protein
MCEEYIPKENKLVISDIMLSAPKSGFGAVTKDGNTNINFKNDINDNFIYNYRFYICYWR